MKILYIASGIPVPGSLGGSTHTLEVARGLVARGHQVHVVACSTTGRTRLPHLLSPPHTRLEGFDLHYIDLPKAATLMALPAIQRLAKALNPDLVMERYYNFAGCGLIAAKRLGLPSLLEVNALIIDPPAVQKRQIDLLLGRPMQRWAEWQCTIADRIVTPLHTTIPEAIPRSKIVELPWGAAVERFRQQRNPHAHQPAIVLFLGSFRAWHGVTDIVQAVGLLLEQGRSLRLVLIGDGPQRVEAERLAARWAGAIQFVGAVPYEQVPALLAKADIGVAPFNTAPHPALRSAGFFWSPLKIYEYMAAGLPVVTANIPPLNQIIRPGQEGLLFTEGNIADLARAIAALLDDPQAAYTMGMQGRERVTEHYSWAQHCYKLEQIMLGLIEQRTKNKEQRTKNKEQRTKNKEQRTKNKVQPDRWWHD